MRAVIVMLALWFSGCAMSPAKHALVAVALSGALKTATETANEEMMRDYVAAGGEHITEEDRDRLEAHWAPIVESLSGARTVLESLYVPAIRKAADGDDDTLLKTAARQVMDEWVKAQSAADAFGAPFPGVPPKLIEYVGDKR